MRTTYIVSIQIHSGHGPAGRINIWRRAAPNTGHNRPKSKINKKINLVWGLAFSDSPCYVFFSFRVPTRGKKKTKKNNNRIPFHPLFQFIMLVHLASRISHTAGVIYIYTLAPSASDFSYRLRPNDTLKQQEVTKASLYLYDSSSH